MLFCFGMYKRYKVGRRLFATEPVVNVETALNCGVLMMC